MSKVYLPKDTYVVCTYQLNPNPKKLISSRNEISCFYKDNKVLLNIADKNTDAKFICKSPMNFLMGIVGVVAGVVLASNPIGWVVAGVCAVLVVAVVAASVYHDCTKHLEGGNWINSHRTVKFNKDSAITTRSMLMCSKGGMLQPIISLEIASRAAKAIANNNILETAVTTASSITSGYLMGKGGGLFKNLLKPFLETGGLSILYGWATTKAMTSYQEDVLRNDKDLKENEIYQLMNRADKEQAPDSNPFAGMNLLDAPDIIGDFRDVKGLFVSGKTLITDSNSLRKMDSLSKVSRQGLYRNPTAQQFMTDLNAGKYPGLYDKINRPGHNPNRLTPKMRSEATNHFKNEVKNSSFGKDAVAVALFFIPLVEGYFSEKARKKMAEIAVQDATNSIAVTTSE